jgi:molybdate transport system substrate-binding protein
VSTHAPLHQQAVVLKRASDNDGARRFVDFLKTPAAKTIIREHGYQAAD